jgi:hypothetical protein
MMIQTRIDCLRLRLPDDTRGSTTMFLTHLRVSSSSTTATHSSTAFQTSHLSSLHLRVHHLPSLHPMHTQDTCITFRHDPSSQEGKKIRYQHVSAYPSCSPTCCTRPPKMWIIGKTAHRSWPMLSCYLSPRALRASGWLTVAISATSSRPVTHRAPAHRALHPPLTFPAIRRDVRLRATSVASTTSS